MHSKLKPCSFCGEKAVIFQTDTFYGYSKYFATCDFLWSRNAKVCRTREEAIEVWDRRVVGEHKTK